MARAGTGPSAGVQRTIAAYVRAGAYPAVAAEAAGVPATVFRAWMERGQAVGPGPCTGPSGPPSMKRLLKLESPPNSLASRTIPRRGSPRALAERRPRRRAGPGWSVLSWLSPTTAR